MSQAAKPGKLLRLLLLVPGTHNPTLVLTRAQAQMIASLQWLGEFRVLACIPRTQSVAMADVATLCSVPETQLARVVRFTATAGFLCEPEAGRVAHTAASQQFASRPSVGDAAMFVAKHVTVAAGAMAEGTRSSNGKAVPPSFAFPPPAGLDQQAGVRRQWAAFMQHAGGEGGQSSESESANHVLARLDWDNLGNACVVDVVGPQASQQVAASPALTARHARLQVIVQTTRPFGSPQPVRDAAVYILRLPHASAVTAELRVHLSVLAANRAATLLIVPTRLLPEPGSVDADSEAAARMRDLSLTQLTGLGGLERRELLDLVAAARDRQGRLQVVSELRARNNMLVALRVCYQAHDLPN